MEMITQDILSVVMDNFLKKKPDFGMNRIAAICVTLFFKPDVKIDKFSKNE